MGDHLQKKVLIYFNQWFTMTTEGSMVRTKKPKRIGETMIGFDLKNNDVSEVNGKTSRLGDLI
jgi:hypothetical protein